MKKRIHLILVTVSILFAYTTTAQNILTVDNNPGSTATYQTLQSAYNAATNGDIIYIQPSSTTYIGSSVFVAKEINIVGRSHSEPNKSVRVSSLNIQASNVTLKGLRLNSLSILSSVGIENVNVFECRVGSEIQLGVTGSSIVSGTVIQGCVLRGIAIGTNTENVLIANNIFSSSSTFLDVNQAATAIVTNNVFKVAFSNPITFINNDNVPLVLSNNMFLNRSTSGDFEFSTGDFILNNNLTFDFIFNGGGDVQLIAVNGGSLTQNNTLANTNPNFVDISTPFLDSFAGNNLYNPEARLEDDLTLQAGSPALTGGTNGSQIGLYGSNFLYKQLGQPRGVPTLDVISNDVTVQQNGTLNITINAKGN